MKIKSIISTLFILLASINGFSEKRCYFGELNLPQACGGGQTFIPCQGTDPCAVTRYCKDGATPPNNIAIPCTTHVLGASSPNGVRELALAAGCYWSGSYVTVTGETDIDGQFNVYSNINPNASLVCWTPVIPASWTSWGFRIEYLALGNQVKIKVFPLTSNIWELNEDAGTSITLEVSDLEDDIDELLQLNKKTLFENKSIFSADEMQIIFYPNPLTKKEQLSVEIKLPFGGLFEHTIRIFDLTGKMVIIKKDKELITEIPVGVLKEGIYIVEVVDMNGILLKKEKIILQ